MKKGTILAIVLIVLAAFGVREASAQNTKGRWALGLHGGVNTWVNDFDTRKIGPGGELMLRYGISRGFSLGLLAGFEELKSEQKDPLDPPTWGYLKLQAVPASLVAWFHLAPGKSFNPYLYVGAGGIFYQRQTSGDEYVYDDKYQTSIHIPVGLGFEAYMSRSVAFTLDLGYRVIDDWTDARKYENPDGYATAKAGLNFYFGSSDLDDDDGDGLLNGEELTYGTNPKSSDTDADMLRDGDEVKNYKTNPAKTDTDADGLSDGDEVMKYKTDPLKTDTDGDSLADGEEVQRYKTDPTKMDTEADGLNDGDEVATYKTDPLKADTDGDGLTDGDEVKTYKSNPTMADTDNDGLSDGDEVTKHRTDPQKVDTDAGGVNDGAEVARKTNPLDPKDDMGIVLEKGKSVVLEGVTFQTGKATLTKESETILEKAFIAMVANPDVKVEIVGHTDNTGKRETNLNLSRKRADAVKGWMVKKGIPASRMTTSGKGPDEPAASNDTPEGRTQNRRIEFRVKQ